VLLALTLRMAAPGVVVTFAPIFIVLTAGRGLLGVVIGGFWPISTVTVMRIVSDDQPPRALAR
jgi:predicted MFS family arabinose efflux permease